jgi:hypothetical protein
MVVCFLVNVDKNFRQKRNLRPKKFACGKGMKAKLARLNRACKACV